MYVSTKKSKFISTKIVWKNLNLQLYIFLSIKTNFTALKSIFSTSIF